MLNFTLKNVYNGTNYAIYDVFIHENSVIY